MQAEISAHFQQRQPSAIRQAQILFAQRPDGQALKVVNISIGNVSRPSHPAMLARMRLIYRNASGRVDALTATEALTKRGSCTSCANLGAALLRAQGIPARIVAGYPTWCGALQTHYVVEYWLPQGGWRLLESRNSMTSVIRPRVEDEWVRLRSTS